jgi:hypothetical protein
MNDMNVILVFFTIVSRCLLDVLNISMDPVPIFFSCCLVVLLQALLETYLQTPISSQKYIFLFVVFLRLFYLFLCLSY